MIINVEFVSTQVIIPEIDISGDVRDFLTWNLMQSVSYGPVEHGFFGLFGRGDQGVSKLLVSCGLHSGHNAFGDSINGIFLTIWNFFTLEKCQFSL